jgi:hypothetical protein
MGLAVLAFGDILCGFPIDLMLNPMGKIKFQNVAGKIFILYPE